jgi:large subunit ribosomal protein L21
MISNDGAVTFGRPYIEGARVKAEIVSTDKTDKVLVFKHQSKKAIKKLHGHRQLATTLKIKEIIGG